MKTVAGSTGQQKLGSGNWAYRQLDIAGRDRDGGFSLGVLVLWQQVPTEAEVSLHLRNLEAVPVETVVNSVCLHFPS